MNLKMNVDREKKSKITPKSISTHPVLRYYIVKHVVGNGVGPMCYFWRRVSRMGGRNSTPTTRVGILALLRHCRYRRSKEGRRVVTSILSQPVTQKQPCNVSPPPPLPPAAGLSTDPSSVRTQSVLSPYPVRTRSVPMGVESGGWGMRPPSREINEGRPPDI